MRGKIGIFWILRDESLDGYKEDVENGEEYGKTIQPTYDHFTYWQKFVLRHPELILLEYDDIPRGRVIYRKDYNQFWIISSKEIIKSQDLLKKILQFFDINNPENVRFIWDEHYETTNKVNG